MLSHNNLNGGNNSDIVNNSSYQVNTSKISIITVNNENKSTNISLNPIQTVKTVSSLNNLDLNNTITKSKNKDSLKILVKFQVGEISKDIKKLPISIMFPEQGYYYISIKSENSNLKLIDVENGEVVYKNTTLIELFEKIDGKEKTYNLIVEYNGSEIPSEKGINISIFEIKIIK